MADEKKNEPVRPAIKTIALPFIILWRGVRRFKRHMLVRILKDALGLVIAATLGAYISSLFGAQAKVTEQELIISLLYLSALIWILTLSVLFELNKSIQTARNYDVFLHTDYRVAEFTVKSAFKFCAAEALKAKKSIFVMGPHFSHDVVSPPGTISHDDYLSDSMNAVVARHAASLDSDFRYERIVQVNSADFVSIKEAGIIEVEQFENNPLARHVKKALELSKISHCAVISISALPFVPSFPSVLVIDDRFVFFSVPTSITTDGLGEEVSPGAPRTNFDLVLGIEDKSGEIPTLFRQVISKLKQNGRELTKVVDNIDKKAEL